MQIGDVKFNYVPYDNAGEAVVAVLGKNIDVGAVTFSSALPYYKSGELKLIAQSLSARDVENLPDVPTIYETPGLEYEKYGIPYIAARPVITPADVPEKMLKAWDRLFQLIVADPDWIAWLEPRYVLKDSYLNGEECTKLTRNNTANVRKIYQQLHPDQK
jgi:tripartite-type tricarboxylate transporter receptor subunit TctC